MSRIVQMCVICALFAIANPLAAAVSRATASEQNRAIMQKMYDRLEVIRHETDNHEVELRVFRDKLSNIEDAIEELRRQFGITTQSQQEKWRGSETKINSHEHSLKGFTSDLEKLQRHANDSSTVLEEYRKQIAHMEASLKSQAKNIEDLKTAMKSLLNALSDEVGDSHGVYQVQPGDSLGFIAQKNHTTVKELKEANNLKDVDTIKVGQKLKIPDR